MRIAAWAAPLLTLGTWLAAFSPPLSSRPELADVIWGVPFIAFPLVGAVIIHRQHANRIGWMLSGIGLAMGLAAVQLEILRQLAAEPGGREIVSWLLIVQPFSLLAYGLVVLLLLTFPDGRLPSRRWRWLLGCLGAFLLLVAVDQAITLSQQNAGLPTSALANPRLAAFLDPVTSFNINGLLLLAAASGLGWRYRRCSVVERLQIKWFAVSVVVLLACALAGGAVSALAQRPDIQAVFQSTGLLCFAAGIGVAVVRYHLYDVDLFISRGLAYLALVGAATLTYVGLVGGLAALVGRTGRGNLVLSLTATAVIAVAFHPLQVRLQNLANRLVYGRRQTPYESLAGFTRQLAEGYTGDGLIQRMADALAQGVRARVASVGLLDGDGHVVLAVSPVGASQPDTPADRAMQVRHGGEALGTLSVWTDAGLVLNGTELRLLSDLSVQAGLVLHTARLTVQLQQRVDELRASRRRLVAAQGAERRRLERDLHDGAQNDLVSVRMKLGLAEREATAANAGSRLSGLLCEVREETAVALENIRRLSRGLYPPLLESQGLTAALTAHARRLPIEVAVRGGEERFSREVETAVYFCCVEALQNTTKHADAQQASILIESVSEELRLRIADDGHGFDLRAERTGAGLQNITDRLEVLGGSVQISSSRAGTRICGEIPAPSHAGPTSLPGR